MDVKTLVDIIQNGGAMGLLVFFLVAGFKGWIVWNREFNREIQRREEIEQERDEWRELALRGTNLADSLVQVQERRMFEK